MKLHPQGLEWRTQAKSHAAMRRDAAAGQAADFWNSTTPHAEKFWMPLVAHLQPEYWCVVGRCQIFLSHPVHSLFFDLCATRWFFLVEFGRKIFINWLYIRGFRSDDGVPRPLFVPGAAASSLLALMCRN